METLFEAKDISKNYGSNNVLRNINLEIYRGEIVGLIGENGAGKSTMMKLIAGVEKPSAGIMTIRGTEYSPSSIIEANKTGVGMVFQEQSLVANLTVAQNIYLGRESKFKQLGFINWNQMNKEAKKALTEVGVMNVDPQLKVNSLDFAARQMVEISKIVNLVSEVGKEGSVVLLDEATTVLTQDEIDLLFTQMRRLADVGHSVVFISHRLDEVLKVTDRIIIFKDGELITTIKTKDADEEFLYTKMVGTSTSGEYYVTERQTIPNNENILEVKDLSRFGEFNRIGFSLRKGEILGLCGLEGSGKESLCSVLCGDLNYTTGEIIVNNKKVNFNSPYRALKEGILSIPKNRRDEGIIGMLSIIDNIASSSLDRLAKYKLLLNPTKLVEIAKWWIKELNIKSRSTRDRLHQLSGGNAQKVVFARVMESKAPIIILNHPTRGVDVGAKKEIYRLIRDITEKGNSIILIGDTLDEVIGLSSRLIIMKDGLVMGEFDCPAHAKPVQLDIIKLMM